MEVVNIGGGLPPISWAGLGLIILCVTTTGGGLIACLLWIYRELNNLRSETVAHRIEVAKTYVSTVTMREVEQRLEMALTKMSDRLDKAIDTILEFVAKNNQR